MGKVLRQGGEFQILPLNEKEYQREIYFYILYIYLTTIAAD